MKKITSFLLVLCFGLLFSQKENPLQETYFPVKYILKNSTDTIKSRVLNLGIYTDEEFSPDTYIRQMTVLNAGKKTKVYEKDIQYMEITDNKKNIRKFVDSKAILSKDLGLLQVMFTGKKTTWYRLNSYSGRIYTYKTSETDYLKDNQSKSITEIHFKLPGAKALLKEKMGRYADISQSIDYMADDEDFLKVLKLYDKK
ncbi:hypothetical protein [Chryseobacterium daeguense]|uniref:hypothetical protein n=1 Tax=Chryseobacterium daeguense TaxID=412438 RepID=UPI00040A26AF|nr:hypothetical protein [Chryseobacterium daeguense]